jgi:hypothetical protein
MCHVATIRVRVTDSTLAYVDALALEHHVTRSEVVRRLIESGVELPELPPQVDLDETLALLSNRARSGAVGAQVALLRHPTTNPEPPAPPADDPLAEIDAFARRNAARNGDGP